MEKHGLDMFSRDELNNLLELIKAYPRKPQENSSSLRFIYLNPYLQQLFIQTLEAYLDVKHL